MTDLPSWPAGAAPAVEDGIRQREELPLAMFPSEHGWSGNGVGVFNDSGGEFILNTDRSFHIETNGAGAESVATSPPLTPVDLTGKHVVFHSLCSFASRLKSVKLRLSSGDIASDYAEVTIWEEERDPIALLSTFERQSFSTNAFAVTGDVDWSSINRAQIRVVDNTIGKFHLYAAGIYAVPANGRASISFCFDDNYASVYGTALRKLSRYRYPASAYVITDLLGTEGFLTLEQLHTLCDQHDWEIGGHSFTAAAHNKASGWDSLTAEELNTEANGLRGWLDENGFRRATFAYPKGAAKKETRRRVRRHFGAGRATAAGPETIPPRDDYTLRGWSIDGLTTSAATIKAAIDQAVAERSWLILTFHNIVAGAPAAATEFKSSDFSAVVDHVRSLQLAGEDLRVVTVADALDSLPGA